MIRLIATDIDGTLLRNGARELKPRYFSVINSLQKAGIRFCAASGRQYHSLKHLFAPVWEDMLFIAENGAEIRYRDEVLYYHPMSMEISRELVRDTRRIPGAQCMYCVGDTAYFEPADMEVCQLMSTQFHFHCTIVEDLLQLPEPCLKYSLYRRERVEEETAQWFVPKWSRSLDVACGGRYFMDVMEAGVNKGSALGKIQNILDVPFEETMVFGDNRNDLEMLAAARYSCAVANARKEVRDAARMTIGSNEEDGVLSVLEQLLQSGCRLQTG